MRFITLIPLTLWAYLALLILAWCAFGLCSLVPVAFLLMVLS